MNGKILKISSNDLYGNVDDRSIAVFAAFNHKKYMNKYVIYTYEGEFDKNKLYYGSLHLKNNSLVVFSVNEATKKYIDAFVDSYVINNIDPNEYELIDISKIEKAEIVSFNERDYDKLSILDKMSIKRIQKVEEEHAPAVRKVFLSILLLIMLALLGGISYLYFFPEKFMIEYTQLECSSKIYNQELKMEYQSYKLFKFDKNDKVSEVNVTDTYNFSNSNDYLDFKNNHKESEYFHLVGEYQYNDEFVCTSYGRGKIEGNGKI